MRNVNPVIAVLIFLVLLTSCAHPANRSHSPSWVDSPGDGVSASAGRNYHGREAQEELAISRARNEFAKRYGVSIDSVQIINSQFDNGKVTTHLSTSSKEEVRHSEVRAYVKEKWDDDENDLLWVWMLPSK